MDPAAAQGGPVQLQTKQEVTMAKQEQKEKETAGVCVWTPACNRET